MATQTSQTSRLSDLFPIVSAIILVGVVITPYLPLVVPSNILQGSAQATCCASGCAERNPQDKSTSQQSDRIDVAINAAL